MMNWPKSACRGGGGGRTASLATSSSSGWMWGTAFFPIWRPVTPAAPGRKPSCSQRSPADRRRDLLRAFPSPPACGGRGHGEGGEKPALIELDHILH